MNNTFKFTASSEGLVYTAEGNEKEGYVVTWTRGGVEYDLHYTAEAVRSNFENGDWKIIRDDLELEFFGEKFSIPRDKAVEFLEKLAAYAQSVDAATKSRAALESFRKS